MAWTLCSSGEAIIKAGAHANSDIISWTGVYLTALDKFSDQAEGDMEHETGMALIDNYASFPAGVQTALSDVCSSKIALKMIAYDVSGYLSREADIALNVNDDIITKKMPDLKDFKKYTLKSPI